VKSSYSCRFVTVLGLVCAAACALSSAAFAAEEQAAHAALLDIRLPLVRLFDTSRALQGPLDALPSSEGWTQVAEGDLEHVFQGDAVVSNDRIVLAVRKGSAGAELYAKATEGLRLRAVIGPRAGAGDAVVSAVQVTESSAGAVAVGVGFRTAEGPGVRLSFRVTTGDVKVEVRLLEGSGSLAVRGDIRYAVVPDFFGDDMAFAPDDWTRSRVGMPAENFFAALVGGSDCILMCVWESAGRDADLVLGERDGRRVIESCEVDSPPQAKAWVAVLEGPGIWRAADLGAGGAGAEVALDWQRPFPARWRGDLVGEGGVAQSYDLAEEAAPAGGPSEPASRTCACRVQDGRTLVGIPEDAAVLPGRLLLIYPIDRDRTTPLNVFCPVDILRSALGVGPCQYILATEGLDPGTHPTPADVTDWVEKQFKRGRSGSQAEAIRERLDQMVEHVAHTQERIERYAAFAEEVRRLCAGAQGDASSAALRRTADGMADAVARGRAATGAAERVRGLADKMVALIGAPDVQAEVERLGRELRAVGLAQDGTLARCRMAVRWMRQQSRMAPEGGAGPAELAGKVRALAEEMLKAQ
jgi:hypothetical protein